MRRDRNRRSARLARWRKRRGVRRLGLRRTSTPLGLLEQLYRFRRGSHPIAALINVNGTLYSTTYGAIDGLGGGGYGTAYSITTSGAHKLLYRFRGGSDGHNPHGLLNVNGTLYGTTTFGGGYECNDSSGVGCGTVYSISTSGTEKVLYAFKGGSDGAFPLAGLIDVNGTLYGTTSEGGSGCNSSGEEIGCGTVFSITASGQETVLHRFARSPRWHISGASLIDVNGTLYGTTIMVARAYILEQFSASARPARRKCCTLSPAAPMALTLGRA